MTSLFDNLPLAGLSAQDLPPLPAAVPPRDEPDPSWAAVEPPGPDVPERPRRRPGGPGAPSRRPRRRHPGGPATPRPRRARRGPQPPAARGRRPLRLPAAHRGRRRLGQDPGAHPPDRLPAGHRARPVGRDPRDHLHQQGRRGDARAGGGPHRPLREPDVGLDLPLGVRADPAPRARRARPALELLHLRRRGLPAAHDARCAASSISTPSATRPRASPARSPTSRTSSSTPRSTPGRSASPTPSTRRWPRRTRGTTSGCGRRTPWTSTTSS